MTLSIAVSKEIKSRSAISRVSLGDQNLRNTLNLQLNCLRWQTDVEIL